MACLLTQLVRRGRGQASSCSTCSHPTAPIHLQLPRLLGQVSNEGFQLLQEGLLLLAMRRDMDSSLSIVLGSSPRSGRQPALDPSLQFTSPSLLTPRHADPKVQCQIKDKVSS